jgi:hypothetical protein
VVVDGHMQELPAADARAPIPVNAMVDTPQSSPAA